MTRISPSLAKAEPAPKRRPLTAKTRQTAYDAAQGRCGRCGQPVGLLEAEYDHLIPRFFTGLDDAAQLRPLHPDCHKPKTSEDRQDIAHVKRMKARHEGTAPPPTQRLRSRGFKRRWET